MRLEGSTTDVEKRDYEPLWLQV